MSLIALLALLGAPAGDACTVGGGVPHSCCATPAPQEPDGCCGARQTEGSASGTHPAAVGRDHCHCSHAPGAPVGIAVGTPTPSLDALAVAAPDSPVEALAAQGAWTGPPEDPVARSAPPPLFLVDCAFLI